MIGGGIVDLRRIGPVDDVHDGDAAFKGQKLVVDLDADQLPTEWAYLHTQTSTPPSGLS